MVLYSFATSISSYKEPMDETVAIYLRVLPAPRPFFCLRPLSPIHVGDKNLVPPARFELATIGLEVHCSIQLSYGGVFDILPLTFDF